MIITALNACLGLWGQAAPSPGNQLDTPVQAAQAPARQNRALPLPRGLNEGETLTIQADQIAATLSPNRQVYHATGTVQIDLRDLRLSADAMSYDSATGEAIADGHVAFDSVGEDTHIEGTHAIYNFVSSTGEFDNFQGVSGVRLRGRRIASLTANPLIFSGRKLLRLGENRYRLESGKLTSCTIPNPAWMLSAQTVEVVIGGNAKLEHAVFRLFDVPIFYAPFLTHSTTRIGRHSGVLLPVASHSNIKGYILGDSFYWPAARNINLTLGTEYYSARGWADHADLESLPTRNSAFGLQLDGVFDRGVPGSNGAVMNQGGQELVLTGSHEGDSGFRSVMDIDYLSSYLYRLVFKNAFADAINSEVISTAFSERQFGGTDLALTVHRYQDFLGSNTTTGAVSANPNASLSLAQLPSLDGNAYAESLTRTLPLYFSWDYNAGALERSEPGFSTGLMSRMDLEPDLRLPLTTALGTFTGDVSVRSTFFSERQQPAPIFNPSAPPTPLAGNLWRDSASAALEWRPPALERVYGGAAGFLGTRLEHVIEPEIGYHYTTGVGTDADEVIRFDDRDILADTR
ncbi:MAG: LPS-assembly protein LptD, partial [Terriglobales bacterium]